MAKGISVASQLQGKPETDLSLSSDDSREAFDSLQHPRSSLFDQLNMMKRSPPTKVSFEENENTSKSSDRYSQALTPSPLPKENIGHLPLSLRKKSPPPPMKQSLNAGLPQQFTRQNESQHSSLSEQMYHSKSMTQRKNTNQGVFTRQSESTNKELVQRNIVNEEIAIKTQPFSQRLNVKVKQHSPLKEQPNLRPFSTQIAGCLKDRVEYEDMQQMKEIKVNQKPQFVNPGNFQIPIGNHTNSKSKGQSFLTGAPSLSQGSMPVNLKNRSGSNLTSLSGAPKLSGRPW